jgi:hypothetical protein
MYNSRLDPSPLRYVGQPCDVMRLKDRKYVHDRSFKGIYLMKLSRLPISFCHANCSKCGLPSEFKMFESGPGGDFSTYIGARTGAIYRLDLGKVHYLGMSVTELLSPAIQTEGKLYQMPEEIRCKICGTVFSAVYIPIDSEEIVDAYEL